MTREPQNKAFFWYKNNTWNKTCNTFSPHSYVINPQLKFQIEISLHLNSFPILMKPDSRMRGSYPSAWLNTGSCLSGRQWFIFSPRVPRSYICVWAKAMKTTIPFGTHSGSRQFPTPSFCIRLLLWVSSPRNGKPRLGLGIMCSGLLLVSDIGAKYSISSQLQISRCFESTTFTDLNEVKLCEVEPDLI